MSPLKLVCKNCGEVIFSMTALEMAQQIVPIPDIIYGRLHGECPGCNRIFTSEDVADWTLKISGEKGDVAFFSKHAHDEPQVFMNVQLVMGLKEEKL